MDLSLEVEKHICSSTHRMTAQRRLILETLQSLDNHPTAEELFEYIQKFDPSIHRSTIYRNLRWLESEGWIQARVFDADRRTQHFDSVVPGEHYHFVCRKCDSVVEFNNLLVNAIKAQFELHTGSQVDCGSVVLYGLCAACREKSLLEPEMNYSQE